MATEPNLTRITPREQGEFAGEGGEFSGAEIGNKVGGEVANNTQAPSVATRKATNSNEFAKTKFDLATPPQRACTQGKKRASPPQPKVSFLLVTYNQENYIRPAIDSILQQDYENFEVIVSDDCSSDGTFAAASAVTDPRVKVVKTPYNGGVGANLNFAFSHASGDVVVLCGGDDLVLAHFTTRVLQALKEGADAVYSNFSEIDSHGNRAQTLNFVYENATPAKLLRKAFLHANIMPSPAMVLTREAAEAVFELSFSLVNYEDYALHTRLLLAGFKPRFLEEKLVLYRVTKEGVSHNSSAKIRARLEEKALMDLFLQADLELVKQMFEGEIASLGYTPTQRSKTLFLALMALDSDNDKKREWGYETAVKFLATRENFELAHAEFGLSFKEFLTYAERVKPNDAKYHAKYLKYTRLFKIFATLTAVLAVSLVAVLAF